MSETKLLIVEHDAGIRTRLESALQDRYVVSFADTHKRAVALLKDIQPDIVSLDLALSSASRSADQGLRVLEDILRIAPATPVIVVAATGDRISARRAIQLGAADYLCHPIDLGEYEMVLKRVAQFGEQETDGARDVVVADADAGLEQTICVGNTPAMRDILAMASLVAKTDATVLVQGESGTGKEVLARAIHAESCRRAAPFVPINCGAIPEGLLEAELFGHEKGAYTGAHVQRKGRLELADSGTVFLDEIAEMSLSLQVKLLRFLQEREVERIGGRQRIRIDTRVIAATNKDLKAEVAAGRLREDLYFRLSVVTITLPPLRERAEDTTLLASEFLRRHCLRYGRKLRFSPEALDAITYHEWPGNIRELENAIQRAVILTRDGLVQPADLGIAPGKATERLSLREARNRVERQMIVKALTRTNGNISRAAIDLEVSRPTLHDLLHKHHISGDGMGWRRRSERRQRQLA